MVCSRRSATVWIGGTAAALALVVGAASGAAAPSATVYRYDAAGNLVRVSSTATDPDNCGAVGAVCSWNHVPARACVDGSCNSAACEAGWADCDGNKQTDGCEASIATVANCGACGVRCSSNHLVPACVAVPAGSGAGPTWACAGTCAADYLDCNGNKQIDGCETYLSCPPTNLVATVTGTTSVSLRWTDNSTNESRFSIQRRNVTTNGLFVDAGSVGANVTTYSDGGLTPATTYGYRVGNFYWTSEVRVTTCAAPPACGTRCGTFFDGCATYTCGCSGSGPKCSDGSGGWFYAGRSCVNGACVNNSCLDP